VLEFTCGDPDSICKTGHAYPHWLTVLRSKYEQEVLGTAVSNENHQRKPSLTLGKFAVFLGSHALDPAAWTPEEMHALEEVSYIASRAEWRDCTSHFRVS
jgi:hypothetical protein